MTVGWVAATIRGRALLRGTPGLAGARAIAGTDTWETARDRLGATILGPRLAPDADRARARTAAGEATVWQLRVLAGWVPAISSGLVRVAAGPLEIANIEGHVAALTGADPRRSPAVVLGSLATAWPRVATTASAEAVRDVLRRSVWGDPGGTEPVALARGLRVAWLRRVATTVPDADVWVRGAMAVVVAREQFAFGRPIPPVTAHDVDRVLGRRWRAAGTVPELAARLRPSASWPLAGVDDPGDLWKAELAVLRRVADEAGARALGGGGRRGTVAAILAVLLLELWRIRAAIEMAGRGAAGREAFDAVAA